MAAPDYQEFANQPNARYPWQYRDLRRSHDPDLRKSAKRCAITTPENQHESGTSCLGRHKSALGGRNCRWHRLINTDAALVIPVRLRGLRGRVFGAFVDHLVD